MRNLCTLFVGFLLFFPMALEAQSWQIGHTTQYYYDSNRGIFGPREIEVEMYYPTDAAGEDVPVASGSFPVLVFGHGFVMRWDSYDNFWERYVNEGYILMFPRTEGNIAPSHGDFGEDLALLANAIVLENTDPTSLFYTHVEPNVAIMGHSMGGGSTYLASDGNTQISTTISFAAAETYPSAIDACTRTTVPSFVIGGADDCVAPPAGNARPMYDSLASSTKLYVNISGASHCQFANSNFNCETAEALVCSTGPLDRFNQHTQTFSLISLWLAHFLKGDSCAWNQLQADLVEGNLEGKFTFEQVDNEIGGNCCGRDIFEPNNTMMDAKEIPLIGVHENARLCKAGDQDWFMWNTESGMHYKIELDNLPADYELELTDNQGNVLMTSSNPDLVPEDVILNSASGGNHFVRVYGANGAWSKNSYTLRLVTRAGVPFSRTQAVGGSRMELEEELVDIGSTVAWKLYPNPVKDMLYLTSIDGENALKRVVIRDLLGREWLNKAYLGEEIRSEQLFIGELPTGVYTVRVEGILGVETKVIMIGE